MGLLLKQLFALIKLLNSETGSNQISSGLAVGLILGFAPFFSIQTILVFLIALLFRIQLGAVFLSAFFFKLVAYLLDPAFDRVGELVLETESLRPFFTLLYNMPLVPLTRFNNTIAMGSMIVSVLLVPFAFFYFRFLVAKYRQFVVVRFKGTKFFKALSATSLYKWYHSYDQLYGA